MVLDELTQVTILGTWAQGRHREDISDLEPGIFTFKKLYKGAIEGKDPTRLAVERQLEGVGSIQELFEITGTYGAYQDAMAQALSVQRIDYVERLERPGANTREITEKINTLDAVIRGEKYKPVAENLKEILFKDLDETENEDNPRYGNGLKYLDKFTGGIHRGQLTIIGARPRTGKTALGLQIATNVAEQGRKVLFIPLEMLIPENLKRILLYAQICEPGEKVDREAASIYLDDLEQYLKFCEGLNDLDGIERAIKAEKPDLVVIDQLSQLSIAGSHKDIREQLILITRNLKRIALEHKVPLIVLSQLNRDSVTGRGKPSLESLAESDSIGQDADNVFLLAEYETDSSGRVVYNPDKQGLDIRDKPLRSIMLIIAKQRNGISGKEIPLAFMGERFTFNQVDTTQSTRAMQRR